MQCGPFHTIDSSDRQTVTGEGGTDDILAQTVYSELGIFIHATNEKVVSSLLYGSTVYM